MRPHIRLIAILSLLLLIPTLCCCGESEEISCGTESSSEFFFDGTILEVYAGSILVKALATSRLSADRISVRTSHLDIPSGFTAGMTVRIYCSGNFAEAYPAQCLDASWIAVIKN